MAKKSSGFNIKDLVQGGGGGQGAPKSMGKPPATKKKSKKPSAGGGDILGQPTPQMPSGMGMGMQAGGY